MYQRDRPIQPDFAVEETLYLRYLAAHFVGENLRPEAIRFTKTSVNRGSLSQPEDVLFDEGGKYNGLGAVEFLVSDVLGVVEQPNGPPYDFFMRHMPFENNYSHSEIWCDSVPATGDYKEPSRTVKAEFRIRLCQRIGRGSIRIEAVENRASA